MTEPIAPRPSISMSSNRSPSSPPNLVPGVRSSSGRLPCAARPSDELAEPDGDADGEDTSLRTVSLSDGSSESLGFDIRTGAAPGGPGNVKGHSIRRTHTGGSPIWGVNQAGVPG